VRPLANQGQQTPLRRDSVGKRKTDVQGGDHKHVRALGVRRLPVRELGAFVILICLGVAVQTWAALQWTANLDSDEAIVGLMVRHILQGNIPTYFYGQAYLGSLNAILSAPFVYWMSDSVLGLRMSALLLFGAFLMLHGLWVRRLWGSQVALISLLVLAFPGPHMLIWTIKTTAPFGVNSVLGTGALLLSEIQIPQWRIHLLRMVGLGIVMGLGAWSHPLMAVYFVSLGIVWWLRMPEWRTLYDRAGTFCLPLARVPVKKLLPVIVLGSAVLFVLALFASGCNPKTSFQTVQLLARLSLLALVAGIGLATFLVSPRRRQLLWAGVGLVLGFILGNLPQWRAWLFFGVPPSLSPLSSCPTDALPRARLVSEQLLPAMWGIPLRADLRALSLPENALWVIVWLTVLGAPSWFIWANRKALRSLLFLSPLSPTEHKPALLWLLFTIPLMLAILSANTINVFSARYLLIAWQASSIILAMFMAKLASRSRALGLALVGLWVLQVGISNLVGVGALWHDRREANSPEAVSTLEEFLTDHDVQGGYADYWIAYTLDYLTEERLTFAPYNEMDRYSRYPERLASLPVHAYLFPLNAIPDQARRVADIVHWLSLSQVGGPTIPGFSQRLEKQVVLERQTVRNWDVWLVTND
jgi:hypothetical protein